MADFFMTRLDSVMQAPSSQSNCYLDIITHLNINYYLNITIHLNITEYYKIVKFILKNIGLKKKDKIENNKKDIRQFLVVFLFLV